MSHAERARRPSADSRTAWRRRRRSDSWAGKTWLDAEKVGVVPQDLHRLVQQDVAVRRCGSALTVARLVVRLVILLVILLGRHGRRQAGRGGVLERDLVGQGLGSRMGQLFLFARLLPGLGLRHLLPTLCFVVRKRFLGPALIES